MPKINPNDVAIIGMACRLPQCPNISTLWQHLTQGNDLITTFDLNTLDAKALPHWIHQENAVLRNGILDNIEYFDHHFFGMTKAEAKAMDPQHRILMECCWTLLNDANYTPTITDEIIGLYAGAGFPQYLAQLLQQPNNTTLDPYQLVTLNDKDFLCTRTAYHLNLQGPTQSIQTACSSSLVAVHQACQTLRQGEADMMIAGGVSIINIPQPPGYLYEPGMFFSKDGYCRPFDAKATGTVMSSGCSVVLLKMLEDAVEDGDTIYATIKGSNINNDGKQKASFSAPSVQGQMHMTLEALEDAELNPETIQYVEAHGTGTIIGDPIEIEALTQAYRQYTDKTQFCAIGSIKSNLGHTDTAAGTTGLIKTALALYHKKLVPSLHYQTPNPHINFANSPFYVNTTYCDWPESPLGCHAAVSAFGIGGTNAHVILGESPIKTQTPLLPHTDNPFKRQHCWINTDTDVVFPATTKTTITPVTDLTQSLCQLWAEFIGIKVVEPTDDFFDLGGDSLLAVSLIEAMNQRYNQTFDVDALLMTPTINALLHDTTHNAQNKTLKTPSSLVLLNPGNSDKSPLFLIHPIGGTVYCYRSLVAELATDTPIYGIQTPRLTDAKAAPQPIETLAQQYIHLIKTVQPKGNYRLGGSSFGGIVAYEMAQQLQQANHHVTQLILMDTPGPGYMPKPLSTIEDILQYQLEVEQKRTVTVDELHAMSRQQKLGMLMGLSNQEHISESQAQLFLDIFQGHADAMHQYQPTSSGIKTVFFAAKEASDFIPNQLHLAWRPLIQHLDVIEVPGNHLSMNEHPYVTHMAKFMRLYLT